MRARLKKECRNKTATLEDKLIRAVDQKHEDKVRIYLDRLHRRGVHEGYAVEAAKKFLSRGERS